MHTTVQDTRQSAGLSSPREVQSLIKNKVTKALELVETDPRYYAWLQFKDLAAQGDPRANFIVDMVRANQIKLHAVIGNTELAELFISQVGSNGQQSARSEPPDREYRNR